MACAGTSGTGSTSGSSSQETPQEETAVEETEDIYKTPLDEYADEYYYTGEEAYYDAEADTDLVLGGWEKTDSPVVTDEMKALTEKASAGLSGARYTPVAYLGHQLVSGTNHLLLCRTASTVDSGAAETYMFVTIYEDLKGSAQITSVVDTGIPTNIADLDGVILYRLCGIAETLDTVREQSEITQVIGLEKVVLVLFELLCEIKELFIMHAQDTQVAADLIGAFYAVELGVLALDQILDLAELAVVAFEPITVEDDDHFQKVIDEAFKARQAPLLCALDLMDDLLCHTAIVDKYDAFFIERKGESAGLFHI